MYPYQALLEALAEQQISDRISAARLTRDARNAASGRPVRTALRPRWLLRGRPLNADASLEHPTTVVG